MSAGVGRADSLEKGVERDELALDLKFLLHRNSARSPRDGRGRAVLLFKFG
mgnify:FL=1